MATLQHIGLIMDGNRRWAKERSLPIEKGHEEGMRRIEPLVAHAAKNGIRYITFWAFSTENWNRSPGEVMGLLNIFRKGIRDPMVEQLRKNGVKVNVIGDLGVFPKDIITGVTDIMQKSRDNNRITANFALNYGGRQEILQAVKKIVEDKPRKVSEEVFSEYLSTKGQPDPDLIIRTGGAKRLSGFLPWQSVYSELYFTETYWPDFTESELDKALEEYANRERRFGK